MRDFQIALIMLSGYRRLPSRADLPWRWRHYDLTKRLNCLRQRHIVVSRESSVRVPVATFWISLYWKLCFGVGWIWAAALKWARAETKISWLTWTGHVNRMDGNRNVSQVVNNNAQGIRLRRWPKNRWWNCVQTDIDKWMFTNWKERSRNRWLGKSKEEKVSIGL